MLVASGSDLGWFGAMNRKKGEIRKAAQIAPFFCFWLGPIGEESRKRAQQAKKRKQEKRRGKSKETKIKGGKLKEGAKRANVLRRR